MPATDAVLMMLPAPPWAFMPADAGLQILAFPVHRFERCGIGSWEAPGASALGRLLGTVSENGRLCRGNEAHGQGDHRRKGARGCLRSTDLKLLIIQSPLCSDGSLNEDLGSDSRVACLSRVLF